MKITIWSDFVCPFCYIGATHLNKALENFEHADEVEIEYKSYQLEPGAVYEPEKTYLQAMTERKNMDEAEMQRMLDQVDSMAKNAGLNYNFDEMKYSNTFKAHKVFQLAKEKGIGNQVAEAFMQGFFTDGEYLNDDETLVRLGVKEGLIEEDIRRVLEDDSYSLKVRQDQQWARTINAKGVPHFVIDDKVSVSGAQPVTVFKQALSHVSLLNMTEEGAMCTDDGCEI